MKLSDFLKVAPALYRTRQSVLLEGPPGIGKTDTVRQLPELLSQLTGEEFGIVEYFLTTRESVDVAGFMVPSKEEIDGTVQSVATYTLPDIIRRIRATGLEHGVLFLDEFGQAAHDMQKAVAQLILDHEVNGFSIPEGWWIVAASNRTQDKAGVNRLLTHVINRFVVLEIGSTIEDWANWAMQNSIHPMAIAAARFKSNMIMSDSVPNKPGPFPTPRSFVAATHNLMAMIDNDLDQPLPTDALAVEIVSGSLGEGATAEFMAFLRTHEFLPTSKEILADPDNAKIPPENRLDAAYAAIQLAVTTAINNKDAGKSAMDVVDKCFRYCTRMPMELQTMACRDLVKQAGGAALNSPSVTKFTAEHRSLVMNSL